MGALQNITIGYEDNGKVLVARIDLTKRFGPSSSGKTTVIASTRGNETVGNEDDEIYLGINCYTKKK